MNPDNDTKSGFLHLSDLIELQKQEGVFHIADDEQDVIEQMVKQNKNGGVAFDLRLGSQCYLSGDDYPILLKDKKYISIKPGQFALLTTYEKFSMPDDHIAFISMRFKKKVKGLINVSGFQVDPGYNGIFIFFVYNAGPRIITLDYKSKIFTIIFSKTTKKTVKRREPVDEIDVDTWNNLRDHKKNQIF